MPSGVVETFTEIRSRSLRRYHSVCGCAAQLDDCQLLSSMLQQEGATLRVAEQLVDALEEFLAGMYLFPRHHKYPDFHLKCAVCGSPLCPGYGAPVDPNSLPVGFVGLAGKAAFQTGGS